MSRRAIAVAVVGMRIVDGGRLCAGRAGSIAAGWSARLDSTRADIDDSADLLFADDGALTPLDRLQRGGGSSALDGDARPPPGVVGRAGSPLAWLAAAVVVAAVVADPGPRPRLSPARAARAFPLPGVPRLVGQRLRIVPPAYTGLPPRDAAASTSARRRDRSLEWTLSFAPQPSAAGLVFAGGPADLDRDGRDVDRAAASLDRSLLYRVAPRAAGTAAARLHRLDAIVDARRRSG